MRLLADQSTLQAILPSICWGGNGDDTTTFEALHSWIMERWVPLSIPRVKERMGMGLGTVCRTASPCVRWRRPELSF